MKNPLNLLSGVAVATCLLFGGSAMAQALSSSDYSAGKTRIKTDYKADKKACDAQAGNAKDICVAEAKGKEAVALAELDNSHKPSKKAQHKVQVAQAEAAYDVSNQKCDDLAGNPKDVCVKEADAALVKGKADAKVDRVAADARQDSATKQADATREANMLKRDADYKVAIEKCDALAGAAKDSCVSNAKGQYGKS